MKKFRFRKEKNNAAIIFKLDMETMDVHIEDEIEDMQKYKIARFKVV